MNHLIDENCITVAQGQVLREIRRYNPLLFDFVLKRHLHAGDSRLHKSVFETRRMFVANRVSETLR